VYKNAWLIESKISKSLDPDEDPEFRDFPGVYITKEFGVPAGTPFFQQAWKIRSEYEDLLPYGGTDGK
jgi:hypothetical protein